MHSRDLEKESKNVPLSYRSSQNFNEMIEHSHLQKCLKKVRGLGAVHAGVLLTLDTSSCLQGSGLPPRQRKVSEQDALSRLSRRRLPPCGAFW